MHQINKYWVLYYSATAASILPQITPDSWQLIITVIAQGHHDSFLVPYHIMMISSTACFRVTYLTQDNKHSVAAVFKRSCFTATLTRLVISVEQSALQNKVIPQSVHHNESRPVVNQRMTTQWRKLQAGLIADFWIVRTKEIHIHYFTLLLLAYQLVQCGYKTKTVHNFNPRKAEGAVLQH